jgi:hypothetical protein
MPLPQYLDRSAVFDQRVWIKTEIQFLRRRLFNSAKAISLGLYSVQMNRRENPLLLTRCVTTKLP